jgi:EF hand
MKPTQLFTLAALIATCSFASAQGEPKKGPPPEIVKEFDKDGDGKLSKDERAAMKMAMADKKKAILEKYDTDKDGKLSPEEHEAAVAAGEKLPHHGGGKGKKGGKKEGAAE